MCCYPFSCFVAKLLGLSFSIIGIFILIRKDRFHECLEKINVDKPLIIIYSFFSLLVGLAIIISHNCWCSCPLIVLTIIGWIFTIIGVLGLFFFSKTLPSKGKKTEKKLPNLQYIGVILLIVGIYLIYTTFFFHN